MHGSGGWHLMRSFNRDGSVTKQQLPKGLSRRLAGFAKPYRLLVAVFLY
jgi:ATP-binding cassette subfamily B protein